jgi:hypothetical protein
MKWYPPPRELDDDKYYVSSLKHILARKIGSYDGSTCQDLGYVDASLVPFLDGLIAGTTDNYIIRDAERLIEAINQYGKVELRIEF